MIENVIFQDDDTEQSVFGVCTPGGSATEY